MNNINDRTKKIKLFIFLTMVMVMSRKTGYFLGPALIYYLLAYLVAFIILFIFWHGFFELMKK